MIVDRCVTTVEYVRIVHRSRLLDWIKSCCYIERYSPLDLFEPASGVIRIPEHIEMHTLAVNRQFYQQFASIKLDYYLNLQHSEGFCN